MALISVTMTEKKTSFALTLSPAMLSCLGVRTGVRVRKEDRIIVRVKIPGLSLGSKTGIFAKLNQVALSAFAVTLNRTVPLTLGLTVTVTLQVPPLDNQSLDPSA